MVHCMISILCLIVLEVGNVYASARTNIVIMTDDMGYSDIGCFGSEIETFNRAIRWGDWKLVALHKKQWELYDLTIDPTELHDLSSDRPNLVREMPTKWSQCAQRCEVLSWPVKK